MNSLPIIDIAPLYADDTSAWPAVAEQIDRACRDWGFFYIVGHPIGAERIDALLSMGFHMPADHPEVLAGKPLRGPNRHPDLPGWQALLETHYADMQDLARTLLRAMAMALDIAHDFFDARFHEPISVLRMIHYPPRHTASSAEQQGAGAHTDYGCITLLYQDDAGGLQVRARNGEWIDAPPIAGSFVVNIGDMMARWSNDHYTSTPHRVISPLGVDRYSMPFFAEPHPDTLIDCLPNCSSPDNPAKYQPVTSAEYLLSRFADTYAYRREEA
ncbi:MAG: 2OG-Fe(II) oxygenase [Gammaproteobacteria bacterium HGW-Gammaproteobacteria-12]|nr:MAG: 2OG-Fe(II) oxygenase [Gammaproteobacteria bacterium HGW-Gammaproteobacteria-12]